MPEAIYEETPEEPAMEIQEMNFYLLPENSYIIIEKRYWLFFALGGIIYFYHFCFTIAGINNYCDVSRFDICEGNSKDASSAVFDKALLFATIYHLIEWVRWTMFLTIPTGLLNVLGLYYLIGILNVPFGIFALVNAFITSTSNEKCHKIQVERSRYLWM
jgi:hypothetical protein